MTSVPLLKRPLKEEKLLFYCTLVQHAPHKLQEVFDLGLRNTDRPFAWQALFIHRGYGHTLDYYQQCVAAPLPPRLESEMVQVKHDAVRISPKKWEHLFRVLRAHTAANQEIGYFQGMFQNQNQKKK